MAWDALRAPVLGRAALAVPGSALSLVLIHDRDRRAISGGPNGRRIGRLLETDTEAC